MFKNICINNLRLLSILFAILISNHVGAFEYKNGTLMLSGPGQTSTQSPPQYYYYTKDHLGNIRSVVTKNQSTNAVTEVQRTHYYPYGGIIADISTGQNIQPRLYNGKELDRTNNLFWYDFVARPYDPTRGQFTGPDLLAEKFYKWNPWVYCKNNPINRIDPDGKTDYFSLLGKFYKHVDDKSNDRVLIISTNYSKKALEKAISENNILSVPSNDIISTMDKIYKLTDSNNKEYGFRVGENGTISDIVEGDANSITDWSKAINSLKDVGEHVVYDVHTHPLGDTSTGQYGKAEPSETDLQNIVGNQPNIVLGQIEENARPNFEGASSTIIGSTKFIYPKAISIYGRGHFSKPVKYELFKRAVYRINKKYGK